jgi:hypothetical protein
MSRILRTNGQAQPSLLEALPLKKEKEKKSTLSLSLFFFCKSSFFWNSKTGQNISLNMSRYAQ